MGVYLSVVVDERVGHHIVTSRAGEEEGPPPPVIVLGGREKRARGPAVILHLKYMYMYLAWRTGELAERLSHKQYI